METPSPQARPSAVWTVVRVLAVLALFAFGPWALLCFYLDHFGVAAQGEVTDKHEVVQLAYDHWDRDFMVGYRYRVQDSGATFTAAQPVEPELYRRLQVGDRVPLHYSAWAPLRSLGSAGATLDGTSWFARLPRWSNEIQFLVEMGLCALTAWLIYLAFTRRSWGLGVLAATAAASVGAGVLLFGFLIFPLLLVAWFRNPGRGLGWALLASVVLSTLILAWRIPWPSQDPASPQATATATVRQVHEVRRVWGTMRRTGQQLRQPYQLVDLEFTPPGQHGPVHALDAVDFGSVPGLSIGAALPIVYSQSEPHEARLTAGTRTYARDLFRYVLLLTYGTGAAVLLVGFPLMKLLGTASRRFDDLATRARQMKPPSSGPGRDP